MLGTASTATATEVDAKLAFKAGRYGTAVQKFSELLLLDPDSYVQLCNRSAALLKLGLPAAAASDARRAVKLSPSPHVKAHYRLACALECTGEWAEALLVVGKALLIQPHHPQLEAIRERCMRELTAPASVSVSASSRTRVTCRRPRPTEALAPRLDGGDSARTVTSASVALVSCFSQFVAQCLRTLFRPLGFGLSAVCRKFGPVAAAHHGHALGWGDTVLRLATSLFVGTQALVYSHCTLTGPSTALCKKAMSPKLRCTEVGILSVDASYSPGVMGARSMQELTHA
ncbi:hypothetical protein AB1Y20_018064 [Prymnesium parvum]|uniref:Uncharacterized protein n=1 Tax=Prymnesium parvum TaxID=97485 RepID=A0AB34JPL5_PRYPA